MEHTTKSDLKLVITHVAEIPLPELYPSITSRMPRKVIEAARRLMKDEENEEIRD